MNSGASLSSRTRSLSVNRQRIGGDSGFTLLELLISVTMLGVIVLIMTAALRLGLGSMERGERKIEALERMRASLNIIDSQIQSQIPLSYNDDGSVKYYFKAGRDSLVFPTNYSVWGGESGYVIASYSVVPADQGTLALYITENVVGQDVKREAKLFDSLQRISFEYFYKDPTEETGNWIEQWTDETTVPEKVRIHLTDAVRDISWIIPMRTKRALSQTAAQSGTQLGGQSGTKTFLKK